VRVCGSQFSERELCGNIGNACIVRERERERGKKRVIVDKAGRFCFNVFRSQG